MELNEYELFRTFKNNEDHLIKIRTEAGLIEDKIYKGIQAKLLHQAGYTKGELKRYEQIGALEKKQIRMGVSINTYYLWKKQEMLAPDLKGRFMQFKRKLKNFKERIISLWNMIF